MFKNQQPLPLGRDHRGQHFTHLASEQRQASLPFSHERDQNKGMCDDRARRGARPGGRAAAVLGEPASSPRQSPGEAGCSGAAPNPPVRSRVCDSGAKRLMRFEETGTHTLSVNPRPAGVTAGTPGTVHLPLPGAPYSQTEAAPVADTGPRASGGGSPRAVCAPNNRAPPTPAKRQRLTFWYFCHHRCEHWSSREAGWDGQSWRRLSDSSCTAAMVGGSTHSGRICTLACWILQRSRAGVRVRQKLTNR